MHRAPVRSPLQTGIKAVDAAIPVGRGQRELIVGDRQTGKTAIAVDAILNQRDTGVVSIYCAIGQRASAVARVIARLREGGAMERAIVVVAGGEDAPGLQFVAPYAATAMAEHFMAQGRDVLIVHDDLTRHARAYRQLSLLLRRPPGREAYPGDIFYIHARLLERATQLRAEHGGGSLTALPVVETQAQNLSAYIPTNLISITDGQIYLSPGLFEKGHLPAIDIGVSVSRVGGKAQLPAFRAVAGDLRLMYAQFEELETFARFGTQLDAETRRKLTRGLRVREVLKQREGDHLDPPEPDRGAVRRHRGPVRRSRPRPWPRPSAPSAPSCATPARALRADPRWRHNWPRTDRAALLATMREALEAAGSKAAMETLESLSDALETTGDIGSIVRTMKALSSVSIRQYERAEEAMADYARTVELGLTALLHDAATPGLPLPAPLSGEAGPSALIVIGSDRGLCGRYNDAVARFALARGLTNGPGRPLRDRRARRGPA
jgi:F-type H+-transporting ATPase subunit alpha